MTSGLVEFDEGHAIDNGTERHTQHRLYQFVISPWSVHCLSIALHLKELYFFRRVIVPGLFLACTLKRLIFGQCQLFTKS
jgi:hypothetical protein